MMNKKKFSKPVVFIGLSWIVLGIAIWGQAIPDFPAIPSVFLTLLMIISCAAIAHILSDIFLPRALARGNMKLFILQGLLMTILLSFFLMAIPNWFYTHFVAGTIIDSPEKMLNYGMWRTRLYSSIPSAILINSAACGLRFYREHLRTERNHAKLQQAHLEAQLRILHDQINPHLMFNVLNHIHILIQKDVKLASQLLIRFSDILRYQLYECNREMVSLEKELKYVKDFIAVEQIRWGKELEVTSGWIVQNGEMGISPLLLIPFVENAFKHVSRLPTKKGYVHINLKQENGQLELLVENSCSDRDPRKNNSPGIGLENVKKRLDILYPDKHELQIQKTDIVFKVNLLLQLKPSRP